MNITRIKSIFPRQKFIIGMIHLPPMPGYPNHPGMNQVISKALTDLEALELAGFNGVLVENDNDQPHRIKVSKTYQYFFKTVILALKNVARIPVGMEIIYDMPSTVNVALQAQADFVRLDVFVDDVLTKWGVIKSQPLLINQIRNTDDKHKLVILTDIHVKHAKILSKLTLNQSAMKAVIYGSDGIIITGDWTGIEPNISDIKKVKSVLNDHFPVIAGSGLKAGNISKYFKLVDGGIVGTSIKNGDNIDYLKAKALVDKVRNQVSV